MVSVYSPTYDKLNIGEMTNSKSNYLQRGVIPLVVLTLLAVVGAGGAATVVSQGSIPGDILYPVKETTENVRVATAFSDESKAKVHLAIADEKLNEIEKLEARGKSADKIVAAAERLEKNQEKAIKKLEKAQSEGKDVTTIVLRLQSNLERQQSVLAGVLEKVPEQAREAIQRAMENSQRGLIKAQEMQTKEKGKPDNVGKPEEAGEPSDADEDI